jgi:hypothetical protein
MNKDVWTSILVSAFLSIPIGILTGLAIPPIQRWYRARHKSKAVAELDRLKRCYSEALFYREHPAEFREYLLVMVIRHIQTLGFWLLSTFFMALSLVAAFMVKMSGKTAPMLLKISISAYAVGGMVGVVISGMIFQLWVVSFYSTYKRVKYFDSYVKTLPKEVLESVFEGDPTL